MGPRAGLNNGDQYLLKKIRHTVTEIHVFDRICVFLPIAVASVKGPYPRCVDELPSLEQRALQ